MKSLTATSNFFFFGNTTEKRKISVVLGPKVWVPKPVYQPPNQPSYMTERKTSSAVSRANYFWKTSGHPNRDR